MLKTYLRIAVRHLRKNPVYTTINIAGLSLGMAIALIIGLWIADEVSFDRYTPNHKRIAQAMFTGHAQDVWYTGETMMMPIGKVFASQYKDLFTRVAATDFGKGSNHLFNFQDKTVSGIGLTAQQDLPVIFDFPMLSGKADATKDPSTIIIAKSLATALFGKDDAIGKTVKLDNTNLYVIGGVYADLPTNSTFHTLQAIFPWEAPYNDYHRKNNSWNDHNGNIYVELAPGVTAEQATAKIKYLPTPYEKDAHVEALIYPIDKAYLYNNFTRGVPDGGRITMVWLFGIIGVFVLLLACINFMNLSTARSEKRAKEVGIRKTIGSLRIQLIGQFLSESLLLAFIALAFALLFVGLSLPFFNGIAAKSMTIPWSSPLFLLAALGFTVFTGLLAGSYPAFYLSGFQPVKVLKGTKAVGKSASLPRQVLVVLQFTVSLTLIIGTTMVFRQILFTKDRPVGYQREGLFTVEINTPEMSNHYESIRTELIQKGLAENVAASNMTPTRFTNGNTLDWSGKTQDQNLVGFNNVNITPDYGKTIGWKITQGRDMSRDFATDSNAAVINEKGIQAMRVKNPIGMVVRLFDKPYTVVGVCANMLNNSPYDSLDNEVFVGGGYVTNMIIKMKPGAPAHATLAQMEPIFKKYNPSSPFLYQFVDDAYAAKFETEERVGNLAAVFTGLAIFISCLGLFGLAAFVAEQRTKEIGVRKVLGASLLNLWGLLSKDFLKLTVLSILISVPLSYWIISKWLANYVYHAPVSWWIFASAGAGIIFITLMTVSYQSLKAALMNPVKSLRSE